jgi:phosphoribosylformylglycinamidine synthase subunit PurQ / glutaminase
MPNPNSKSVKFRYVRGDKGFQTKCGKNRKSPDTEPFETTMSKPRVLILRAPGANCDLELQFAFCHAGAAAERIHINRLLENSVILHDFQILAIPGGFTYGDDVAAGKILAVQLSHFLGDAMQRFRDEEKLILGVCNGFQVLLKAGLLIPPDEDGPLATLTHNASGKFEDRWIHMESSGDRCPFLKDCGRLHLPVAHAEGKFICREPWILKGLEQAGQVVLRYVDSGGHPGPYWVNPNGSEGDVAGICDVTGRVLGLMPHPERHLLPLQHPRWTREGLKEEGDGMQLFRNAVSYFQVS